MATRRDAHVDSVLTNFARRYPASDIIWPEIMPIVKVNKVSDLYYQYSKDDLYRLVDDRLGITAIPNRVDVDLGTDTYSCRDHGLEGEIAQATLDNQDRPLDLFRVKTEGITQNLHTAQEARVAAKIFAAASYPTGNKTNLTSGSNTNWGEASDDPIGDIQTAVETCFVRANTLVFGVDAWLTFRKLPEILDAVKASTRSQDTPGGMATASEIAALFEVDKILIGRGRQNTAKKGQTGTYSRIWGKHMAALYVPKAPTVESVGFGFTFAETQFQTTRGFNERQGTKGVHWVKTAWNSDEKIVASDCGYLIENAVI